ncbi:RagB/SusD family nutrient uptake outer membrane protein [Chitinophaga lutea]
MKHVVIRFSLIALIVFQACERFVDVDPPIDQLVKKKVFDSNENAAAAMTGLYGTLMRQDLSLSYYLPLYTGMYSDELEYKQSSVPLMSLYNYNQDPREAPSNNIWSSLFNLIYQANAILEGLSQSRVSEAVGRQLRGEALFMRAFCYLYLLQLYGPVPVVTATDYTVNSRMPRAPATEAYARIREDLLESRTLLTEKYVAANATTVTAERIRPNVFTVQALTARTALLTGEWKNAEDAASAVIASNLYQLEAVPVVFKRTSREVIWQLELPLATTLYNTYEANNFIMTYPPIPVSPFRSSTLSPLLTRSFDTTDLRGKQWIGSFTNVSVTPNVRYLFPAKYKSRTSAPVDEYTTPFRLAEMYLTRAEARAQQDNLSGAISDLDRIRQRAGILPIAGSMPGIGKAALLDSIMIERKRELFTEWGLRWFDIRRSPNFSRIMQAVLAQKGITWDARRQLWPIPQNDIVNNNQLVQNESYQ